MLLSCVRVLDIRTDRFGDLKNVHPEVVYAAKWSQNGVRIWTDRFGDLKNVHPEVVYAAKWSQNGIRIWTDHFGDLKNVHPEVVYAAKWSQNGSGFGHTRKYCKSEPDSGLPLTNFPE